jgi:hypothetical protein
MILPLSWREQLQFVCASPRISGQAYSMPQSCGPSRQRNKRVAADQCISVGGAPLRLRISAATPVLRCVLVVTYSNCPIAIQYCPIAIQYGEYTFIQIFPPHPYTQRYGEFMIWSHIIRGRCQCQPEHRGWCRVPAMDVVRCEDTSNICCLMHSEPVLEGRPFNSEKVWFWPEAREYNIVS